MKHYELMYIIPVKIGQEDSDSSVQDKVRTMLQAEGAKLTHEEDMGKRKLAYPVNHVRHGSYVLVEFDFDSEKIAKLNEWFRLSPDVLRHQLIAKKLKSPEQLAREKAFQEKLQRKQQARAEAEQAEAKGEPIEERQPPVKPTELPDLDKRLEEILEREMVK
jgi:small subunit ribosomal protein S6